MTLRIPRRQYADLFGPTAGDRIRLADTELLIEVERDLTVAGEEAKFGGGKVLRDGMGQSATCYFSRGRTRSGHHQRGDPGSLGNRQGRYRDSRADESSRSARPVIPISWTA